MHGNAYRRAGGFAPCAVGVHGSQGNQVGEDARRSATRNVQGSARERQGAGQVGAGGMAAAVDAIALITLVPLIPVLLWSLSIMAALS